MNQRTSRPARLLAAAVVLLSLAAARARAGESPTPTSPVTPVATTATAARPNGPGLKIRVFAMGQADSMLIVGPESSVLVDCGAPNDANKDVYKHVKDEIKHLTGRAHVDALVVTHFHSDHTGEAADAEHPHASGIFALFAEGVTVTSIIDHGDDYGSWGEETHPHKQWVAALPGWKEKHVYQDRHTPKLGEKLSLGGGAELRFVAVGGNGVLQRDAKEGRFHDGATPSENDYSIAFVASLGNFEFYSGGDLSGEDTQIHKGRAGKKGTSRRHDVYDDIETGVAPMVGNIEVMRIDHHGSPHSTNEAFASTLKPEVSIISCGANNPYHHPSPDVVARLQAYGPVIATSGLSADWKGRADAPKIGGDLSVTVSGDGATYVIAGKDGTVLYKGKSFSDAEEADGLDHPGKPGP